jgi:hypothetical protein
LLLLVLSAILSYHVFLTQMVNTRKGGAIDLPPNNRRRRIVNQPQPEMNPPPNPPPVGVDPVAAAQMQLLQQMANTMMKMQAQMR